MEDNKTICNKVKAIKILVILICKINNIEEVMV